MNRNECHTFHILIGKRFWNPCTLQFTLQIHASLGVALPNKIPNKYSFALEMWKSAESLRGMNINLTATLSTYCGVVKMWFIVSTNPIIHHLQELAIRVRHVQTRYHGNPSVQPPNGGAPRGLQPRTRNETYPVGSLRLRMFWSTPAAGTIVWNFFFYLLLIR